MSDFEGSMVSMGGLAPNAGTVFVSLTVPLPEWMDTFRP